jgi:hypothetical protein
MSISEELRNTPELTWSHAGGPGESAGMVWYGMDEATEEDVQEIRDFLNNQEAAIDELSVCGRHAREWNSNGYDSVGERNPNGGEGSAVYEQQKVGMDNVQFAKEPIWFYTADGDLIKDIPPNAGAYHQKHISDGYYDNIAGPEPDSPSHRWLKYLIAVSVLLLSGCGVTYYKSAEVCDGTESSLIGITFQRSEQCMAANLSDGDTGVPTPPIVVPVED